MGFKIGSFRGAYPGTFIPPTEKELQWLFNALDKINASTTLGSSSFKGACDYCDNETDFTAYRIPTEDITDVAPSDWDGYTRGLQLTICSKCECWNVVDY